MKYEKPAVRLSTEAIRAIESVGKPAGPQDNPEQMIQSTPAYEADE